MRAKRLIATLILGVLLSSVFSMASYAALPKNTDVTLYFEIPPGYTTVIFSGAEVFGFKDDNGTRYDTGWEWKSFPEVTSDRPGFVKYHFVINDWGGLNPEEGKIQMFTNHKLDGQKEDGTGTTFWDAWNKEADDATATGIQKNHSLPIGNIGDDKKVIITVKWDTKLNDYVIVQDYPATAAPVVEKTTVDNAPAETATTETATVSVSTTSGTSKSPATGDNDLAFGFVVIIAGVAAFGFKKALLRSN